MLVRADSEGDDSSRDHIERRGNRFLMTRFENGKKVGESLMEFDIEKGSIKVATDGVEVGSANLGGTDQPTVLRDAKGPVSLLSVERDGKKYTQIELAGRKMLLEGRNWEVNIKDGDLFIVPTQK
jgi:hypothetical protein